MTSRRAPSAFEESGARQAARTGDLEGRVAVVTGASRGVGRGIAPGLGVRSHYVTTARSPCR